MRWHRRHHSCGIVKMASNDEKRLYVFGGYHSGHWRYWYDPSKIRNVLLQEMGHLHEPGHHEWVPPRVRHPLPDQRHEVREDRPLPLHADWRQHSQLGGHKHCQLVPLERCKLQVFWFSKSKKMSLIETAGWWGRKQICCTLISTLQQWRCPSPKPGSRAVQSLMPSLRHRHWQGTSFIKIQGSNFN